MLTGPVQTFSSNYLSESSVQEHPLGTFANGPNGSTFRYVKCGTTTTVPGKLYDGPTTIDAHQDLVAAAAAGSTVYSRMS